MDLRDNLPSYEEDRRKQERIVADAQREEGYAYTVQGVRGRHAEALLEFHCLDPEGKRKSSGKGSDG